MRRVFISGMALLLCGAIAARNLPAPADPVALTGKSDPLVFVFLRLDTKQDVAILRPMIAPDVGVQLDPATRTLKPGTVLRCNAVTREHHATIDGQPAQVTELALDCGDHQFVVKGLDFSPRPK